MREKVAGPSTFFLVEHGGLETSKGGLGGGEAFFNKSRKLSFGGGRNRIGRREKWPKKSWEEGEIGGKSKQEGEKKLGSRQN